MEPMGKLVMGLLAAKIRYHVSPILCQTPQFGFMPFRAATDAILCVATHSRCIRTLVRSQRRTVSTQVTHPQGPTICGGISLFLDLTRAFENADRQAIFDHLITLRTPSHLVQLVASWHENTHYNLVFRGETTSIKVGKGLRQGCKIAPLLWVNFMDLFMQELALLVGSQWIQDCLTIYADDVHLGCQFRSTHELRTHLQNIGHALDVIERLKLSLSYSKSYMLMAYTGTNPRKALKGVLQRNSNGVSIRIPRQDGITTDLPLKKKGTYLGVIISYDTFEQQTWAHRRKAGWSAFSRLRSWLRSPLIPTSQRLYLWQTCVHTVMTYGIMATMVTPQVLMEYQATVYQMVRSVLGDHAYVTHRTHQSAFRHHRIALPLDMLTALAMGLHRRLCRRAQLLHPMDFLHRQSWTHLDDLLQLIHCVQDTTVASAISVDPADPVALQARHQCTYCSFQTDSVANMRRHLTSIHHVSQYRTASTSPLDMMVNGLPKCRNCMHTFATWKNFFVHVQRNCCQVTSDMTDPGVRLQPPTASDVVQQQFQIATQAFWPDLHSHLLTDDWTGLGHLDQALAYLTHHCAICGTWCNRFQEIHGHYRLYHPDQLQGGVAKGAQLSHILQLVSPCALCKRLFSRIHSCPVTLQVGILRLQLMEPDHRSQTTMTCEICIQQFDDSSQLYTHLSQDHGMTLNDWLPSRDSLQGQDQCRHCHAQFDSRSGLRRHITEGRCEAFDPTASQNPMNNSQTWTAWLKGGDFSPGSLTAQQRLQLTITCQFCGTKYQRGGDLVAHLLQSHGERWTQSQPILRFLLQAVMAARGCICNPQINEVGLAHICTPLRQVAMLMVCCDVQLLVPQQFQTVQLDDTLSCLRNATLAHRLTQILVSRDFARLWTDSEVTAGLRTQCMQCGGHYQPPELLRYLLTVHPQACAWAAQIAFQLYDPMQQCQHQDFRCDCCTQVFNLPGAQTESMPDRQHVQRSHFASNCPVVLQIATLLHPIHGRVDGSQRPGFDGGLERLGSFAAGQSATTRGSRRRAAHQAAQGQGQKRTRRTPTGSHHINAPPDGATDPQSREKPAAQPAPGLLRYVLSKPAGGHSAAPHLPGQQMEGGMAEAAGQPQLAQPAHLLAAGSHQGTSTSSTTAGQQQTRGPTLGCGAEQGHDPSRWGMGLPEVVGGNQTIGQSTEEAHADADHASDARDAGGSPGQQSACRSVQESEDRSNHNSLATPTDAQGNRSLGSSGGAVSQHSVVVTWNDDQTPQPGPLQTGSAAPENHWQGREQDQRQGERPQCSAVTIDAEARHALRAKTLQLVLENPGNACHANSSILALIWANLSRQEFKFQNWGPRSTILQQLLQHGNGTSFSLAHEPWFVRLIDGWIEEGEQADSAEFSHMLSSWTAMPAISNSWERRAQMEQNYVRHDSGDQYMPLILQMDTQMIQHDEVSLSALLRSWSTELGMQAGITDPEDLLLLHINRLVMTPTGALTKSHAAVTFGWEVQIPVWATHRMDWTSYTVVACIAHQGDAQQGHYQCMLRTYPEVSDLAAPAIWMLCDDGRAPRKACSCQNILPRVSHACGSVEQTKWNCTGCRMSGCRITQPSLHC